METVYTILKRKAFKSVSCVGLGQPEFSGTLYLTTLRIYRSLPLRRQFRIYLASGSVSGKKEAEIDN